jgi:hypothetical protein
VSGLFDGKPSLGWLRLAILFVILAVGTVSMLLAAWAGDGDRLGMSIMFHGFAVAFSLPMLLPAIVRFWYPKLLFDQHDGQPFSIGRFGRTALLAIGLAVFVGFAIGGHFIDRPRAGQHR